MVGAPVIIKHQDVTDRNADELRCGVISKAYFNEPDGWYYCEGIIWDTKAQELINNKDWSVSCSYDFLSYNDEGGIENNIKYDKEFTQLNFTHLALVNNPRYERANIVFNSKDEENGTWITIKGNHIFIPDGKTLDEVIKEKGWGSKGEGKSDSGNKQSDRKDDENQRNLRKRLTSWGLSYGDPDAPTEKIVDRLVKDFPALQNHRQEIIDKVNEHKKEHYADYDDVAFEILSKTGEFGKSDTKDKHGFKKDKDSGYYMKDLPESERGVLLDTINTNLKSINILKSKTDNSKEQDMTLLEEIKKLITKVENEKGEQDMDEKEKVDNEQVDKRKLIDEVGGMLKNKVDEELWRTIIGKLEKLSYNGSEDSKTDNKKVKNEEDEKDEKEDDVKNKKVKNEEDKKEEKVDNEDEEDEEKVKEVKKEVKEDVDNKCKNSKETSFDKINAIYNSVKQITQESKYVSRQEKLDNAVEYFK